MKCAGFIVNLTTKDANNTYVPVKEMGVKLPKVGMTRHIASCYVESVQNLRFGIKIKADRPFPYRQDLPKAADPELSKNDSEMKRSTPQDFESAPGHDSSTSSDESAKYPYNFTIDVYLDGKETSDVKRFLYIDPAYDSVMKGQGKSGQYLGYSLKRDSTGHVRKYDWAFQEAGGTAGLLDSFNDLCIGDPTTNRTVDADKELAKSLASTQLISQDETRAPGQIKIVVRRVIIHADTVDKVDGTWDGHGKVDSNPDKLSNNIKHSTAYQNDNNFQYPEKLTVVRYSQYIKNEEPYVTFIFYYRSEDVLKKFGFIKDEGPAEGSSGASIFGPFTSSVKQKHKMDSSGGFGDMNKRFKENNQED